MAFNKDELCYQNLKSYWQSLVSKSAKPSLSYDSHVMINTGIDHPLFNPIFVEQLANLDEIKKVASRGGHSIWMPQIEIEGDYIMQHVPMMSYDLNYAIADKSSDGVRIEQLEQGADLVQWIEPVAISFALDDKAATIYRQCLQASTDKFIHFVAKKNGCIVGACTLFLADNSAGCYNLAVLPKMRNQGIASALHASRLHCAKYHGYKIATLQATPMATHLDLSLGFKTHYEICIQA